ncbi:MAG: hypothetical protein COB13_009630 [OCS116 cluster bacterium]|nr:hypothetical protein [OCS116 cluster bacterium]
MAKFNMVRLIENKIAPAVFLLFFAPFIGELLSAHQTPLGFLNPLSFIAMALPYGFGALIVRELLIRWGGGMFKFFLLALAFGLYEEGIVVRSFFNPNWSELGALQGHDFAFGVSWTFAFILLHFHLVFSMWVSISLAEMLYAKRRNVSWLSNKMLGLCILGLALWLPAGWLMTTYMPPIFNYLGVIVIFIALIFTAYILPPKPRAKIVSKAKLHSIWFFVVGVINVITTYFMVFIGPEMGILAPLPMAMGILFSISFATFGFVAYGTGLFTRWSDQNRLSLAMGVLSIFFFISVTKDLDEGFVGGSLVVLVTFIFLFQLYQQIKIRSINED